MRVLVLSQYFRPESFRINEVVDSLSDSQDVSQITVLTGQPNYPEGNIFKGYRGFSTSRKQESGVDVVRVPLYRRGQNSSISLFLNYLSFIFFASTLGLWHLRKNRYDVVFCYAPSPVLQAIPGILFSKLTKSKFVLHVQDLWPQSLASTGYVTNSFVLKGVSLLVKSIYNNCHLILVSSYPFKEHVESFGKSLDVRYFPNSVDDSYLNVKHYEDSRLDILKTGFNCVFAGNLGAAQSVETIVQAADELKLYPDIKLVLFGSGSKYEWIEEEKKNKKLTNLILMGRYPVEAMPYCLSNSSCLMVTLKDTDIFRLTVPNKIQAYLATGRPIIASIAGEGGRIVKEAKAGLAIKPSDPFELASAIKYLASLNSDELNEMGFNGKNYFCEHFEHNYLIGELIGFFKEVVSK